MLNNYIIVSDKPWHIKNFYLLKNKKNFYLIKKKSELNLKFLNKIKPKYIFFPHWSHKVKKNIIEKFCCICFHETNLPYGRGGSPIQNLILRNKKKTFITAFKMNSKLDSGPIIAKRKLSLDGSAQKIYDKSSKIMFKMVKKIIDTKINLKKQKGKVITFKRLQNNSEIIKDDININKMYNKIRMLDAETYPKAYIKTKGIKIEFMNVKKFKQQLHAKVIIKF